MKAFSLILALAVVGCTQAPEKVTPKEEPVKTHPAPRHKPRRMVCGEKNKIAVVAVIDTGFSFSPFTRDAKLCKFGHKNFTHNLETYLPPGYHDAVPVDNHGHGTNIVGVIQDNAGDAEYCMVVIKYYDPKNSYDDNLKNTIKAIKYATSIGAKYINYSGGGPETSDDEKNAVKAFIRKGGKFVAAAGNERSDIDLSGSHFYPAMDDARVIAVGNAVPKTEDEIDGLEDKNKEKKIAVVDGNIAFAAESSNYGYRVNRWEYGTNVSGFGVRMTGTSQAAAIATGKIVKAECSK